MDLRCSHLQFMNAVFMVLCTFPSWWACYACSFFFLHKQPPNSFPTPLLDLRLLHSPDVSLWGHALCNCRFCSYLSVVSFLSGDGPLLLSIFTEPWQHSKNDSSNVGKLFSISSKVCCVCRCAAILETDTLWILLPRSRSDDAGVSGLKCNHGFVLLWSFSSQL